MTTEELGVKNFRCRLVIAVRDPILRALQNPEAEANWRNIPKSELGPLADLSSDQRVAMSKVFAEIIDSGIQSFLNCLVEKADGFEIIYDGIRINDDGTMALSDFSNSSLSDESEFDDNGQPKVKRNSFVRIARRSRQNRQQVRFSPFLHAQATNSFPISCATLFKRILPRLTTSTSRTSTTRKASLRS